MRSRLNNDLPVRTARKVAVPPNWGPGKSGFRRHTKNKRNMNIVLLAYPVAAALGNAGRPATCRFYGPFPVHAKNIPEERLRASVHYPRKKTFGEFSILCICCQLRSTENAVTAHCAARSMYCA